MTFTWSFEQPGTWGPKCGPDGTRTYQITISGYTDVLASGPQVLSTVGLPLQFVTPHPDDALAICSSIDPQQDDDDSLYWRITYGYSTKIGELAQVAAGGGAGGSTEPNPTHADDPIDRRPKVNMRTKMYKKLIFRDQDRRPLTNRAGVPYEAYTLEVPRLVIDVERNLPDFDFTLLNQCVGGVNVNPVLGMGIANDFWQVKCEDATASLERDKGRTYWRVRAQLIVGQDNDIMDSTIANSWWYEWKLNAGYEYLDGTTLRPALVNGQRPSRPLLLNNLGGLLNGTGRWVAGGADAIFLGARVLPEAPINALGLFV